jgi:tyrosyl-DNA phosphodiesterase-1
MERLRSPPHKRVKTQTNEPCSAGYKFEVFLNDDVEPSPIRKDSNRRAFYELFEKDWKVKPANKRFAGLESVLLMTFAASRELLRTLLEKGVRLVLTNDCGTGIKKTFVQTLEDFPNFMGVFPQKEFTELALSASFHPKLFMLKFNDRLRLIIGNGNLLVQDWSFWDNAFWSKDYMLPFQAGDESKSSDSEESAVDGLLFAKELHHYVKFSMSHKWETVKEFLNFGDEIFTFVEKEACLITSLPGQWTPENEHLTSFYQIRRALKTHQPATPFSLENTSFVYVASSIGTLNIKLMSDFAESVFADQKNCLKGSLLDKQTLVKNFSVIYPSRSFVEESVHGSHTTSCLFLRKNDFRSFRFPKAVLKSYQRDNGTECQSENKPKDRIPHLKIGLVSNSGLELNDDSLLYIGSHNFTAAAWGKLEKDKPQSLVFNYELGVLIPPKVGSKASKEAIMKTIGVRLDASCFDQDHEPFFSSEN